MFNVELNREPQQQMMCQANSRRGRDEQSSFLINRPFESQFLEDEDVNVSGIALA